MDLFLIFGKIWRYRLITVPVMLLTLVGAGYSIAVKKPIYQATASYLLVDPPAPPTDLEIARNPALANVHSDNPYTRFGDQGVIIDVLSRTMSSTTARAMLLKAGADPRYMVASGAAFGSNSPILEVTGIGSSPQSAIKTADVVSHAVLGELARMQKAQNVDSTYRIKAMLVESPQGPQIRDSGQLRMLIAILAVGAIFLFAVVSVSDGVQELRKARALGGRPQEPLHVVAPTAPERSNGHAVPPSVPAGGSSAGSWFSS